MTASASPIADADELRFVRDQVRRLAVARLNAELTERDEGLYRDLCRLEIELITLVQQRSGLPVAS
jgi:hypothetical protein